MSLYDQNRMLHILHGNGVTRENVKKIMEDLKHSGVFDEPDVADEDDYSWEVLERKADIWFDEELEPEEKLEAISHINIEFQSQSDLIRTQNLLAAERRIQNKIREMEEKGLVEPEQEQEETVEHSTTRYGRTPLHEAIAMRNIGLVKKYVKNKLFLTCCDNNGHTPLEMAFYEGYQEAMRVFKAHQSKK